MVSAESSSTRLSLISRVRVNDSTAWHELVALYSPLVAFWCRKQGVDESEINDSAQEIFFAVSRSIDNFKPAEQSGGFRAWLWTIARHKIIDARRRDQHRPRAQGGSTAIEAAQQIPERLDERDDSERLEFNNLLHRALEQVQCEFEAKTWQAFWRSTIDGVSIATLAAELDISAATIRQYRSRVLRRLRQQIGEQL